MKKNLGLIILLIVACLVTYFLNDRFLYPANLENLLRRTALFSLISIGVSLVITTGGIDLSIGSIVCLTGTLLPWLAVSHGWPWPAAALMLLFTAAAIGASHGLLITRLKLQPFIVTLCGLLIYRGVARGITADQTQGFGLGFEGLKMVTQTRITLDGLLPVAIPSIVFITATVALIAATIINFFELYAIAAAVLGGCSLRGGEWSIIGIMIGSALMQVLRNAIVLVDIPTQLEFAIIGGVILLGVVAEEVVRRMVDGYPTNR